VGLYYLRARYFNEATGRFWARDSVWGKLCCGLSWNPYIYTRDNPVNAADPTGRGLVEDAVFRAWYFTQITVPGYIAAAGGDGGWVELSEVWQG